MRTAILLLLMIPMAVAYTPTFLERDHEICTDQAGKPIIRVYYSALCPTCKVIGNEVYKPFAQDMQSKGLAYGLLWEAGIDSYWRELLHGSPTSEQLPSEESYLFELDNPHWDMKFEFGCRFWRLGYRPGTPDRNQLETEEYTDIVNELNLMLSACGNDAECDAGQKCCNTQCVQPSCTADSQCAGQQCKQPVCANPGACNAACTLTDFSCKDSDGCCPPGCYKSVDNDCTTECFNDGQCPGGYCCGNICKQPACTSAADCDDHNPCSVDVCSGIGCSAVCEHSTPGQCTHGDGCCPDGCYTGNDNDCTKQCLEDSHCSQGRCCNNTCITAACTSSGGCDDQDPCTSDYCLLPDSCASYCQHSIIGRCAGGDSCCPAGCYISTDSDCSQGCMNNANCGLGSICCNQTCSRPSCIRDSECEDNDSCTQNTCLSANTCSAYCQNSVINSCASGDSCCPAGCYISTDSDCSQGCMNNANCGSGSICCNQTCSRPSCIRDSECEDNDSCTQDACLSANTCTAYCNNQPICSSASRNQSATPPATTGTSRRTPAPGTSSSTSVTRTTTEVNPQSAQRAGENATGTPVRRYQPAEPEDLKDLIVESSAKSDDTLYYGLAALVVMAGAAFVYYRRVRQQ